MTIAYPGSSAEEVDAGIAGEVIDDFVTHPSFDRIQLVSRPGVFEGYVEASDIEGDQLLAMVKQTLDTCQMPADIETPTFELVETGIPEVNVMTFPVIDIIFDDDKLAEYGLQQEDVWSAVRQRAAPASERAADGTLPAGKLDEVGGIVVTTKDGRAVPLRDVALMEPGVQTDCIVRTHPD